jgi:undecaprenyl-diphosphatase
LLLGTLDTDAFLWVIDHRAGWLDPVFIGLSVVGYAGLVWIALAVVLSIVARMPLLTTTAVTAVCVWTADLITMGLKPLIDRPRPFEAHTDVDPLLGGTLGSSLPSGHAATSFAGAVALGALYRPGLPYFLVLAAAISYSRVYVGVHYPFDVLVGAAIGATVSLAVLAALRFRRRTSEVPPRPEAAPPRG